MRFRHLQSGDGQCAEKRLAASSRIHVVLLLSSILLRSAERHNRNAPLDILISDSFLVQVMKLLGEGGSGQTWLCRHSITTKLVAIKFIKRPIPKIVLPMLMYEIKVR